MAEMADEDATLASVLAFLEAFDAENEAANAFKTDSCASTANLAAGSVELSEKETKKREKQRRRRLERYTTQLQRRKRAELVELREEAKDLELQLAQMQRRMKKRSVKDETRSIVSKNLQLLREVTANELRRRRESERSNARLRKHLEDVERLRFDLSQVIAKHQKKREEPIAATAQVNQQLVIPSLPALQLLTGDSQHQLQSMYELVDCVLAPLVARQTDSCWLESSVLGIETEIRTSTMAECSVEAAERLLWRNPVRRQYEEGVLSDEVSADGCAYSKAQILPVICRPWKGTKSLGTQSMVEVQLRVQHYARRFRDTATNRVIIVVLAHIRVPALSRDILLQEHFWTCITPTDVGTSTLSCYRIGPGDPSTKDLSASQKSIVRALTFQTRQNHATLQNWLLDTSAV